MPVLWPSAHTTLRPYEPTSEMSARSSSPGSRCGPHREAAGAAHLPVAGGAGAGAAQHLERDAVHRAVVPLDEQRAGRLVVVEAAGERAHRPSIGAGLRAAGPSSRGGEVAENSDCEGPAFPRPLRNALAHWRDMKLPDLRLSRRQAIGAAAGSALGAAALATASTRSTRGPRRSSAGGWPSPLGDQRAMAAHLLRRAGFGYTEAELEAAAAMSYDDLVDHVVNQQPCALPMPADVTNHTLVTSAWYTHMATTQRAVPRAGRAVLARGAHQRLPQLSAAAVRVPAERAVPRGGPHRPAQPALARDPRPADDALPQPRRQHRRLAQRELRARADGALHPRPGQLHGDRRARGRAGAQRPAHPALRLQWHADRGPEVRQEQPAGVRPTRSTRWSQSGADVPRHAGAPRPRLRHQDVPRAHRQPRPRRRHRHRARAAVLRALRHPPGDDLLRHPESLGRRRQRRGRRSSAIPSTTSAP